ncbi:hypothetical protein TRVA0_010S00606 [Trichomonascus vanleenenianus]|uniref:phosphatidylinositol 4,5-bisphosphate-binding protein n=1 Tax=Trichomonascus vanleenenianus TaxID=2268995 RepID=UPI003ECAE452
MDTESLNMDIPTDAQPTDLLAARFSAWRKVIRQINVYLKEVAWVQDEVVRQQTRLGQAVSFPFFDQQGSSSTVGTHNTHSHIFASNDYDDVATIGAMFMSPPSSSVSDLPATLTAYHQKQAAHAAKCAKELSQTIIPRLEDLRHDLVVKIKEIKSLAGDFRNSVAREQAATAKDLKAYNAALDAASREPQLLSGKQDPYLTKQDLDTQLVRQVAEENYLLEAYQNLQSSGRELEQVVVQEVQQALATFGRLMNQQGRTTLDELASPILNGFVAQETGAEWDAFVQRDAGHTLVLPNNPQTRARTAVEIAYPGRDSLVARCVRQGYLERRSKYLKSYSRAWYVLTPSFLHEFKSPDRKKDPHPVMSLSLADCSVSLHNKKKSSAKDQAAQAADADHASSVSHKFVLTTASARASGGAQGNGGGSNHHLHKGGHNWVFRAESRDKLQEWFTSLTTITRLTTPEERARAVFNEPEEEQHLHPQHYHEKLTVMQSPVPSDTSGVTSNDDPRAAQHFVVPGEEQTSGTTGGADDNASVFSYDIEHKTASTFPEDKDFKPVDADIPVEVERKLTMTSHKDEDTVESGIGVARKSSTDEDVKEQVAKRRGSVASNSSRGPPSRKATGSYGTGDDLKPLTVGGGDQPLFFANGLPETTGGKQHH